MVFDRAGIGVIMCNDSEGFEREGKEKRTHSMYVHTTMEMKLCGGMSCVPRSRVLSEGPSSPTASLLAI